MQCVVGKRDYDDGIIQGIQLSQSIHSIASTPSSQPTYSMPAAKKESTIYMVCKAIGAVRKGGSKGVSRAAIANYLVANFGKTAGAHFNATLRQALAKGIKAGVLREGETAQRFKLGENAKSVTNPPKAKRKKVVKKKVTKKRKVSKKKKTTKRKKKKTASKKKKPSKKVSKKKKRTKRGKK